MIRWYDWAIAFIAADFMAGFVIRGLSSNIWWESGVYGILLAGTWNLWVDHYCQYRLKQELNK